MPAQSPHFVSSDVVERVISWDDVIAQVRKAYCVPHAESVSPPRTVARDAGLWLRTLTAVPPGARYMGVKSAVVGHCSTSLF
jgi:alanine dehydrogenase